MRSRHRAGARPLLVLVVALLVALSMGCSDDDTTTASSDTAAPTTGGSEPSTTASPVPESGPNTPAPSPLAEKRKLTVAIPLATESYLPMMIGNALGEFEKENLELDISVLPIPDTLVLLAQGKVDITPGFSAGIMNAVDGGADLKMVAPLNRFPEEGGAGLWVRTDLANADGTVDPCVLEGKTVSFGGSAGLGATSSWWINEWLAGCKTETVTIKDVQVSTLGGGDLLAALQNGSVDAGALYDPHWKTAEQNGYAVQAVPNYKGTLGGYYIGPSLLDEPDVVDAFVRALIRTSRTYLQGEYKQDAPVRDAIVDVLGIPAETVASSPELVFDPNGDWDSSVIDGVQKVWIEAGGLLNYTEPIPADEVFDSSYLERVLGS